MPGAKGLQKQTTHKEIVSAMFRLSDAGLEIPVNEKDLKRLPKIPNTGARVSKKGHMVDHSNFMSLEETDEATSTRQGLVKNNFTS